jgi:hypothetical protein
VILCLPCAALIAVLDGGFYVLCPANAKNPFIVDMDTVVMSQVVIDTAVTFVRACRVDFLNLHGKPLILGGSVTGPVGYPLVVGGTSHMKQLAGNFNGVSLVHMTFFYGFVNMALPHL